MRPKTIEEAQIRIEKVKESDQPWKKLGWSEREYMRFLESGKLPEPKNQPMNS